MGLHRESSEIHIKNYRHNEFYGYQLKKDLAESGLDIDMTRLYRILNASAHVSITFTQIFSLG
jgi:hypothetical protein